MITTLNEYINTLKDVNKDAVRNWVNSDKSSSIKEYNHGNNDDDSEKEQTPRKCETCEMYIGNMAKEVTEEVIKDIFKQEHADMQRCKFTHISETHRSNNNKNFQEGTMEKRMDQLEKMVRSFFLPHQPPNLLRAPIPQVPTKQVPIIQGFAQGIPPMYHQVPYVPYETQRNM